MQNESLAGRVDFNERRARALESAVMYQPSKGDSAPERPSSNIQMAAAPPSAPGPISESSQGRMQQSTPAAVPGEGSGRRRRRRRRGRRGGGQPPGPGGAPVPQGTSEHTDSMSAQAPSAEPPASEFHDEGGDQPESDDGGSGIEPQ